MTAQKLSASCAPHGDVDLPLPYAVTLPVLGIATRFATNDRAMLEIVDEAFGVWRALAER